MERTEEVRVLAFSERRCWLLSRGRGAAWRLTQERGTDEVSGLGWQRWQWHVAALRIFRREDRQPLTIVRLEGRF